MDIIIGVAIVIFFFYLSGRKQQGILLRMRALTFVGIMAETGDPEKAQYEANKISYEEAKYRRNEVVHLVDTQFGGDRQLLELAYSLGFQNTVY